MRRLIVVGAGATVEECQQSGNDPGHPLPTMRNCAGELFNESAPVQQVVASYLQSHGIAFDDAIIRAYAANQTVTVSSSEMEASPRRVFQWLESAEYQTHNVERLFEHVWRTHGDNSELWEALAWDTVFTYFFNAFITQFGLGPATSIRRLVAGQSVAGRLLPGDRVVNLNYDIALDLALQQSGRYFTYAPEYRRGAVIVYKPHGSFNLYVDRSTGDAFFADPSAVRGSVALRDSSGHVWSPASAIVPPRLAKTYEQHPTATRILSGLESFQPDIVTFWGVGLTLSDADLMDVYRSACAHAERVEYINPDPAAFVQAQQLLHGPSTGTYSSQIG